MVAESATIFPNCCRIPRIQTAVKKSVFRKLIFYYTSESSMSDVRFKLKQNGPMLFRALLATLLLLSGSQAALAGGFTLVPGPALQQAAALEVKGRNGILIKQKLQFGGYQTAYVKRGAIRQWMGTTGWLNDIWMQSTTGKQAIHFALTNGSDTAEAVGTPHIQREELIIDNPNSLPTVLAGIFSIGTDLQENNLSVALHLPGNKEVWSLFLDNEAAQLHRREAAGYLRQSDVVYTIHPVWQVRNRKGKIADMPFGAAGLEFRNAAGDAVAAVNLMADGAVHINEALPAAEKLLLSTACTALLLQSVI